MNRTCKLPDKGNYIEKTEWYPQFTSIMDCHTNYIVCLFVCLSFVVLVDWFFVVVFLI